MYMRTTSPLLTRTSGRTYWWQHPGQCPSKCCTQTSPGHAPFRPPRFRRCCCRRLDRLGRCCSPRPWIPLCWPAPCHSKTGDPRPPLYSPYEWGRLWQTQSATTCLRDPSRAKVSRELQTSVTGPRLSWCSSCSTWATTSVSETEKTERQEVGTI